VTLVVPYDSCAQRNAAPVSAWQLPSDHCPASRYPQSSKSPSAADAVPESPPSDENAISVAPRERPSRNRRGISVRGWVAFARLEASIDIARSAAGLSRLRRALWIRATSLKALSIRAIATECIMHDNSPERPGDGFVDSHQRLLHRRIILTPYRRENTASPCGIGRCMPDNSGLRTTAHQP
jgi:hypothetical protein